MALYLYQVAYTPESWALQTKNPQDVRQRVQAPVAKLGGNIESLFYSFGEYDIVAIIRYPDNVSAAAGAIVFAAGGSLKAAKTTPLMTVEEGLEAMRQAAATGGVYSPPVS